MKLKIITAAIFAILLYSCAPKVNVTAMQPDPVQVPPKIASPNEAPVSEDVAAGKMLYDNKCGNCHKLFAPADFSKEDWGPILTRMQKKAGLGDVDMAKINSYIFYNL